MNFERFIAANAVSLQPLQCRVEVLQSAQQRQEPAAEAGEVSAGRASSQRQAHTTHNGTANSSRSAASSVNGGDARSSTSSTTMSCSSVFHAVSHLRESAERLLVPMRRAKYLSSLPPQLRQRVLAATGHLGDAKPPASEPQHASPLEVRIHRALGTSVSIGLDTTAGTTGEGPADNTTRAATPLPVRSTLEPLLKASPASNNHSVAAASVAVKSSDFANIRRIAEINAAQAVLDTKLVTKNYHLTWLLQANHPPTGALWKTLDTLRTDHLTAGGGSPDDNAVLLNSPRSVLVCLRNGTHPMALQCVPVEQAVAANATGATPPAVVRERHALEEQMRRHTLESLRMEYHALCHVLPMAELLSFYQLLAGGDAMLAPDFAVHPVTGKYFTLVSGDRQVSDAISKMEIKEQADQQQLAKILHMELETSIRIAAEMEKQQQTSYANDQKLLARQDQRQRLKAKDAALLVLEGEMKQRAREAHRLAEEATLLQQAHERDLHMAEVERTTRETVAARRQTKQDRALEKAAERRQRADAAAQKVAHLEQQRVAQAALKESHRLAMQSCNDAQRAAQTAERQQHSVVMKERLSAINAQRLELQEENVLKSELNTLRCQERLQAFVAQTQDTAYHRHLGEMKRQIMREEAAEVREQQRQFALANERRRKADRETTFQQQRQQRADASLARRIDDAQITAIKAHDMAHQDALAAFEHLSLCGELEHKAAKACQLRDVQEALNTRMKIERARLAESRRTQLELTDLQVMEQKRASYLTAFNATCPSDAHKLRRVNELGFRRLHPSYGSMHPSMTPIPQQVADMSPTSELDDLRRPRTTSPTL